VFRFADWRTITHPYHDINIDIDRPVCNTISTDTAPACLDNTRSVRCAAVIAEQFDIVKPHSSET
jgi:hypothetical protein